MIPKNFTKIFIIKKQQWIADSIIKNKNMMKDNISQPKDQKIRQRLISVQKLLKLQSNLPNQGEAQLTLFT